MRSAINILTIARNCDTLGITGRSRRVGNKAVESSISSLLSAAELGEKSAAEALFVALYSELHRLARRQLANHRGFVSLGTTTLLHEAYLDFANRDGGGPSSSDRGRFMSYAAKVMRGLVIDHARNRCAIKRGGQFEITSLPTDAGDKLADSSHLSQISDALDELARLEPELAEIVDLKFFCGFSFAEIADMRRISERTVQRKWEKARTYLYRSCRADLAA
jgi:RNA polymerase sigma factor (TIGR02999 family)